VKRGWIVLAVILLVGVAGWFWRDVIVKFSYNFEKTPPIISSASEIPAIGASPIEILLSFFDERAGIGSFEVTLVQENKTFPLIRESLLDKPMQNAVTSSVSIDPKKLGLRSGPVEIIVSAKDRALWSNEGKTSFASSVDLDKPRISVLSSVHNVTSAGVGMVIFKAEDPNLKKQGILVGTHLFPGYQVKLLDEQFSGHPEIFFSYFSIPFDFDLTQNPVKVIALDSAGNEASASFNFKLKVKQRPTSDINLSEVFLRNKTQELYPAYLRELKEMKGESPTVTPDQSQDLIYLFRQVNEGYRDLSSIRLETIFKDSQQSQLWHGAFGRPLSGSSTALFGQARTYRFKNLVASNSFHDGVDLASVEQDAVHPANAGVVLFVGDLGIYGGTVAVDHGFGLGTIYSHLSSMSVTPGQSITSETVIGRTGTTGLAGGDHLHYEIRLNGVSIRPEEWWDFGWIRDHLDAKIEDLKKELNPST